MGITGDKLQDSDQLKALNATGKELRLESIGQKTANQDHSSQVKSGWYLLFSKVLLEHNHDSSLTTIHGWVRTTMSQLSSCNRDHVATELKYSSSDPDIGLDSGLHPLPT